MSLRDAEAIREAVPGVEMVAPKVEIEPWEVLAASGTAEAEVFGVAPEHASLVDLVLERG